MKIAFDIGGVLSKYPDEFNQLISGLRHTDCGEYFELYIITDQHPKEQVIEVLIDNGYIKNDEIYTSKRFNFGLIDPNNIYCANYSKYGEMCKAILLRDLKIDIFIDDFPGYVYAWDYSWGKPPLRLLVTSDPTRSYHAENWIQPKHSFGKEKWEIEN